MCSECKCELPFSTYSGSQASKGSARRCSDCVAALLSHRQTAQEREIEVLQYGGITAGDASNQEASHKPRSQEAHSIQTTNFARDMQQQPAKRAPQQNSRPVKPVSQRALTVAQAALPAGQTALPTGQAALPAGQTVLRAGQPAILSAEGLVSLQEPTIVDGSTLEGGGQVVRCALSLAWLNRRQVTVHSIRAGRSNPGLGNQHLAGARLSAGAPMLKPHTNHGADHTAVVCL